MPLATQAKLLRVLQNQEVQRVGALNARKVDVRVIAATNHDLRAAVAEKRFREDLYYRLSMVEIQAPRLAERKEDLPLLQLHFVARFAAQYGKQVRGLTHRAQIRLSQHSWPGNVRELENVIGHAAMMTTSDMVDVARPASLPARFAGTARTDGCGRVCRRYARGSGTRIYPPRSSGDRWRGQHRGHPSRRAAHDLERHDAEAGDLPPGYLTDAASLQTAAIICAETCAGILIVS